MDCKVKDFMVDIGNRLELCEALLRHNSDIKSSGVYAPATALTDEIYELVCEQLDTLIDRVHNFEDECE